MRPNRDYGTTESPEWGASSPGLAVCTGDWVEVFVVVSLCVAAGLTVVLGAGGKKSGPFNPHPYNPSTKNAIIKGRN